MKKRTISKLKSLFGSKKGKRQQQEAKSRSPSPAPPKEPAGDARPLTRTPPPTRAGPPPSPPVPTHPIAPVPPEPPGPVPLHPCPVCNRTFVPQSLAKHVKICEKMTVKKRKTFDSSRQRREGTDLDQFLPKNFGLPENSPFLEKSPPNTAKTLPKPKPTSVKNAMKGIKPAAELQRCPHCNRTFGVRAFERHVEWCADKAKILPAAPAQPPPHIADAKQRLNARTQYKAPLVRTRRSSQSREKSSNSRSTSVDSSRGVSPPPPREYGDYGTMRDKQGRSRASESVSSNDHEDMSPHVPVIRNSRNSTSQAGDSNPAVKARQARLARDLSSTRISQDSSKPLQQSATDPKINKNDTQPKKHESQTRKILNKKQQQLKKLEEIAHKYNERQTQRQKELAVVAADRQKKIEKEKKRRKEILKQESENKKCLDKSQIPVPKIPPNKKETREESIKDEVKVSSPSIPSTSKGTTGVAVHAAKENKNVGEKHATSKAMKRNTMKVRESSMSLDSLEEGNKDPNHQTIGTNTELHCPCVPCIIHENVEQKVPVKKKSLSDITDRPISSNKTVDDNTVEPTVELLFKNLAIVSSCDIQARDPGPESKESILSGLEPSITSEKDYSKGDEPPAEIVQNKQTVSKINDKSKANKDSKPKKVEVAQPRELSNEEFEDEYEHDMSGDFEDSIEASKCESLDNVNLGLLRHGSGDTYTKFTENPDDLEEFINLTDKMISTHNYNEIVFDMDKEMEEIHTPKTSSIEAIAKNTSDNDNSEGSSDIKSSFSETLQDLKIDLQKLLDNAGDAVYDKINEEKSRDRTVSDMEHITVYQLNIGDKEKKYEIMDTITEVNYSSSLSNSLVEDKDVEFKLPSIAENNRSTGSGSCTKEKAKNIYISNQKYKMLGQQSRNNKDNQTFVKEQDDSSDADWSISADAPPLKLPRIEDKRLDDSYDPFLSAARQMKELMSSDTNISKSVQKSCKDHNRTLPNIRPAKEKPSIPYLTTSNPKIMKDSLNKTYQKTPTLQRMKSFDNTNNNQKSISTFGSRCSSFRLNRNDKQKSSQKLNTTFTKSSKENISTTDKNFLNRSNTLNRSFSSYHTSAYSTPKPKDKIPKIATSYHSFQRTTIKQPVKLDKIKRDDNNKKDFVNLDSILADDKSSMTDSNYIDPRLINENDNLPINVNTILNNPDIISSMESLLTSEHLPAKFESFSANLQNNNINNNNRDSNTKLDKIETNNNFNSKISTPAVVDDLSTQYDKIMSSLEQSMTSKASIRDDDSLCEDFDLEEFMTSFDEEIHKHKESKRTCSSTTRILRQQTHVIDSNKNSELDSLNSSPKILNGSNDLNPVNKSNSFNFSSNNVLSENLFPSSVKRASSLLDSIQKKGLPRVDTGKSRHKADQLEQDIMQSLKEFDNFYESERVDNVQSKKEINYSHSHNGTTKRESRVKSEKKAPKSENVQNGNYTPNGKSADSAYSSLNRISPSKLSVCNSKESNGLSPLDQIAGSDSSGCQKDETRSDSSEEFLAMERSAELDEPIPPAEVFTPIKEMENPLFNEKRAHSRTSSRRSPACWARPALSSSGSEASLQPAGARRQPPAPAPAPAAAPRLSRFCHECGCKFPVDSAKFCTECGVKRLLV